MLSVVRVSCSSLNQSTYMYPFDQVIANLSRLRNSWELETAEEPYLKSAGSLLDYLNKHRCGIISQWNVKLRYHHIPLKSTQMVFYGNFMKYCKLILIYGSFDMGSLIYWYGCCPGWVQSTGWRFLTYPSIIWYSGVSKIVIPCYFIVTRGKYECNSRYICVLNGYCTFVNMFFS